MRRYLLAVLLSTLLGGMAAQAQNSACFLDVARINARPHRDCAAPVAIYVQGSDIVVLAVDDQPGPDRVAATAQANGEIPARANAIIGTGTNPVSGKPVIISRLTTGEYQLNTFLPDGTPYVVVWYKGREDLYHLDPATGAPLDGAQPIVAPNATNPSAGGQNPAPIPGGRPGVTSGGASAVATEEIMISLPAPGMVPLSNCRVTTTRIVRLRTAADPNSAIMTRLPYGTSWTATERTADWFRVIYQNTQGWVSAEFLTTTGNCDLAAG
jgi:hypothetical protein